MEAEELSLFGAEQRRVCTNWITDFLAVSCLPNDEELDYWLREGVKAVVSLVEEWELSFYNESPTEYFSKLRRHGFDVLHVSVPDGMAPSPSECHEIVSWIERKVGSGQKVVIHCINGMGRSPTVAIAYLMYRGYGLEKAIATVAERNPRTSLSNEQYYKLLEFRKYLRSLGSART